jgi:phage gp36-like protein
MKTHDELKNCPHCGSNKVELFAIPCVDHPDIYKVYCCDCHLLQKTEEEAVDAWNKRSNKHAEFLEELKNSCKEIIYDTASKVLSRAVPTLETQFELGKRKCAAEIIRIIEQFEPRLTKETNKD